MIEGLAAGGALSIFRFPDAQGVATATVQRSRKKEDSSVSGTDSTGRAVYRNVAGATTYFPVRQHSYFRPLSLTRTGSTVTISGQAMYYSLYAGALRPLGVGTSVALRRGTYGTSSTSYLKTVKVGQKGIVRVSFTSSSKYAYQLFYPGELHRLVRTERRRSGLGPARDELRELVFEVAGRR